MDKMKLKKNMLSGLSGLALAIMLICSSNITSYASESVLIKENVVSEGVTTRSAIIEWRYKIEDGKLYRRLYNYTEQCWVGEWEWCP